MHIASLIKTAKAPAVKLLHCTIFSYDPRTEFETLTKIIDFGSLSKQTNNRNAYRHKFAAMNVHAVHCQIIYMEAGTPE